MKDNFLRNLTVTFMLVVSLFAGAVWSAPTYYYASAAKWQINGPGRNFYSIATVKSDTVDLVKVGRAVVADSAGVVYLSTTGGTTNQPVTLVAGQTYACEVTRVYSTGTTITGTIIYD